MAGARRRGSGRLLRLCGLRRLIWSRWRASMTCSIRVRSVAIRSMSVPTSAAGCGAETSCWRRSGRLLGTTRSSSSPGSSAWGPATSRPWPRSTSATSGRWRRARRRPRSSSCAMGPTSCPRGRWRSGRCREGPMPETRLLLKNAEDPALRTLASYKGYGGYATLEQAYRDLEADEDLKELEDSGLRGRGGAGFSMGKKASFLPRGGGVDKYLCCNADESEPGAFKDRELMQRNPHQLIEGIAIAALAAGIGHAFIFIRGEYDSQADVLDAAVTEAYEDGYLGKDILGSRHDLELVVHRGAGAYICGEETALLDALEGKRGNPRLKPPFPAVQGLYGGPTLINNVETLSNVPGIVANGAEWFRRFGTEQSPGTKVVSISGCVQRPGNYEVELGISTRELIYGLAGGPPEGREVKAFYPGGSSSPVLTGEDLNLPYSFEAMAEAGSMLGSGSIIVADDSVSIPHMALRTARFYHHESCGKCTPCREGTNWTVKMLERVVRGEATPMDLDIVASVQDNIIGHCLCVLGDSMAMPVGSMVKKFRAEFDELLATTGPALDDVSRIGAVVGAPETLGAST